MSVLPSHHRGKEFILDHLQMQDVSCYWERLLTEYSRLLTYKPTRKNSYSQIVHRPSRTELWTGNRLVQGSWWEQTLWNMNVIKAQATKTVSSPAAVLSVQQVHLKCAKRNDSHSVLFLFPHSSPRNTSAAFTIGTTVNRITTVSFYCLKDEKSTSILHYSKKCVTNLLFQHYLQLWWLIQLKYELIGRSTCRKNSFTLFIFISFISIPFIHICT